MFSAGVATQDPHAGNIWEERALLDYLKAAPVRGLPRMSVINAVAGKSYDQRVKVMRAMSSLVKRRLILSFRDGPRRMMVKLGGAL